LKASSKFAGYIGFLDSENSSSSKSSAFVLNQKLDKISGMTEESQFNRPDVPRAVISRLSLYLRELQQFVRMGRQTVSSTQLSRRLGNTDAQVRKDLAYFGHFGQPGKGYDCNDLIGRIREILGTDRTWPVALVGCGNLGQALLGYHGFDRQGFQVVAAFDTDPKLIGKEIGNLRIVSFHELPEFTAKLSIRLAILAVPTAAANQAVESIIRAGIHGILNFAPVTLTVPKNVSVIDVDMAMELEQLAFAVIHQKRSKGD
jgi:redox-sensing transcriptional repressor